MTKFDSDDEFPPHIAAAFDSYPTPPLSRDFEANFWTKFEARRGRYRGFAGFLRRLWEIEIEGVAVWRLMASTFSGGAACALFLGVAVGFPDSKNVPIAPAPLPKNEIPPAAMNAFAFYNRDWENDFLMPPTPPKTAPPKARTHGGDFSWNGSNARLA